MSEQKTSLLLDLNHTLEKESEIFLYLKELEISIVYENELKDEDKINYILVNESSDLVFLSEKYSIQKNNIQIITFDPIERIKDFLLSSGAFSFHSLSLKLGPIEKSILYNFFKKESSIHLHSYFKESFSNIFEFILTNHSSMGEISDEMTRSISEKGFNGVTFRSFFDHLVLYLSYLNKAKIAKIPYEFELASNDRFISLGVSVSVSELILDHILFSFNEVDKKNPALYLLSLLRNLSDFLIFNYEEKSQKFFIFSLWDKKEEISGFIFDNIKSIEAIGGEIEEDVQRETYLATKGGEVDLPGEIEVLKEAPPVSLENILEENNDKFEEEIIKGAAFSLDDLNRILGSKDEEEEIFNIKGKEAKEVKHTVIKGIQKEKEESFHIKGKKEEKEEKMVISSHLSGEKISEVKKHFKREMQEKLKDVLKLSSDGKSLNQDDFEKDEVQKIIKGGLKEILPAFRVKSLAPDETVRREKEVVSILGSLAPSKKEELKYVIKEASKHIEEDQRLEVKSLSGMQSSTKEKEILKKLHEERVKNKKLETKINELLLNNKAYRIEQEKISNINEKIKNASEETSHLSNKNQINDNQSLDFLRKEQIYKNEINALSIRIASKDEFLIRARDNFTRILSKKDDEIKKLQDTLSNKKQESNNENIDVLKNNLEKQTKRFELISSQLDTYKQRYSDLFQKFSDSNDNTKVVQLEAKNRALKLIRSGLEEKINKYLTHIKSLEEKLKKAKEDRVRLEKETLKEEKISLQEGDERFVMGSTQEIGDTKLKAHIESLEQKILTLSKEVASNSNQDSSKAIKMRQLESQNAKLSTGLQKAKNDLITQKKDSLKLKAENTSLKNQLSALKREVARSKTDKSDKKAA